MSRRCWIGTSGWMYPHWEGAFYPQGLSESRWFDFYAQHFPTVEINNTFYCLPRETAFQRWQRQAPPDFRYALKANRYITHIRRLRDCAAALERFLSRARLLGDNLGPILYQLPPNWRLSTERLASFLSLLPSDLDHVFEFRDPSWLVEPVFRLLEEHNVGFCIVSMPGMECPLLATSNTVYIRFHGQEILYGDRYSWETLAQWAEHIGAFLAAGHQVYAYFNNDAFGYAVENALELMQAVDKVLATKQKGT